MTGRTIVLLRHGAHGDDGICAGRRHDPALSPEGRTQSEDARHRLGAEFSAVWSSPLVRARQTAEAWAAGPVVDDRLAERDFGSWEGCPWVELWPTVPDEVQRDAAAYAAFTPPGGETLEAVAGRAVAAVREVAEHTPVGSAALVVTHGGPLRLVVSRLLGLPDHRAFALGAAHGRAAVLTWYGGDEWALDKLGA